MVQRLVLLESGGRTAAAPRATWAVASTALHVALITGAVLLTMRATTPAVPEPQIDIVFPIPAPVASATPRAAPALPALPGRITLPPFRMPTVPGIQPDLTPLLRGPITDRIDPLGLGAAGSVLAPGGAGGDGGFAGVHVSESVDKVVVPLTSNPAPEYPAALRGANVAGEVLVRFVVDTTGRVEPASIQVLQATHDGFGESVRAWLRRTRYQPAELQGRRVRQLVEQRVNFTLQR